MVINANETNTCNLWKIAAFVFCQGSTFSPGNPQSRPSKQWKPSQKSKIPVINHLPVIQKSEHLHGHLGPSTTKPTRTPKNFPHSPKGVDASVLTHSTSYQGFGLYCPIWGKYRHNWTERNWFSLDRDDTELASPCSTFGGFSSNVTPHTPQRSPYQLHHHAQHLIILTFNGTSHKWNMQVHDNCIIARN